MDARKRLGKGLEDISHLFISREATTPSEPSKEEAVPERSSPGIQKRYVLVSAIAEPPVAVWAFNFATALSRVGRRCLVIENHVSRPSLAQLMNLPPVRTSLTEFLSQPDKEVTVGDPEGVRLLAFPVRQSEFKGMRPEECDILFEILKREEEGADCVIATIDGQSNDPSLLDLVRVFRDGVVVGHVGDPAGAYRCIKLLIHHHPEIQVGLVLFGSTQDRKADGVVERLTAGVRKFLDRQLHYYGLLPADPLFERSVAGRVSVFHLGPNTEVARRVTAVSTEITHAIGQRVASDDPDRLIFERIRIGVEQTR